MNCLRIKSIDRFNNKESSLFAKESIKSINKQISSFLLKFESYLIRLSSSIVEHHHSFNSLSNKYHHVRLCDIFSFKRLFLSVLILIALVDHQSILFFLNY